jgi:integrase
MTLYNPSSDFADPAEPGPAATSDKPFLDAEVPSIAAVIQRIGEDMQLSAPRRAALASALRTMARLLGQDPQVMPAMPGIYRSRIAKLTPAGTGLSAKRLANIRSDVLFALRRYGIITPRCALPALSPPWRTVWDMLNKYQRCGLSRFMRWCSAVGVEPDDLDDEVVTRFLKDLEQESFIGDPRLLVRKCCRLWNTITAPHGGALPQLTVPRFHQCYVVRVESLPDTFQADLAAFCDHLAGTDPLAENGPPRPLRPISVFRRRFQVMQLVSGLIERGRPAETMRTLADIASPDALRDALSFFLDRAGGGTTTQISQLAYVALMIAKHWTSADAATIAAIRKLQAKVACSNRGMTDKNAARLRQFEDPENLQRLLLLPEKVFSELRHRGDRSQAACVQARAALAVAILLAAPIRLGNLVALRLGVHLLSSRRGKGGAWHLVIPADETKNTRALEFALPAYVVALLRQYQERYRPLVAPPDSDYLFAAPSGGHLATDNLGPQISRFVRQRTGLEVNPHLFRHLAAKLVLEDTPGGYGIAQDILGHKNPMTTRNFYAGTETAASLRHFERIVQRKRGKLS